MGAELYYGHNLICIFIFLLTTYINTCDFYKVFIHKWKQILIEDGLINRRQAKRGTP